MLSIALVALLGCGNHPSPLGTLSSSGLSAWTADCETPIVEENPNDPSTPGPTLRDGGPGFASATRRYRCPPPGWAIYTDDARRVVGFCVDDDTRPYMRSTGSYHDTVDHEIDRARKLVTKHWGSAMATQMMKDADVDANGDHCSAHSRTVAPNMVRWGMSQLSYPNPETIRSLYMCCWEVTTKEEDAR